MLFLLRKNFDGILGISFGFFGIFVYLGVIVIVLIYVDLFVEDEIWDEYDDLFGDDRLFIFVIFLRGFLFVFEMYEVKFLRKVFCDKFMEFFIIVIDS